MFSSEIHPRKRKFIEDNIASASSRGRCTVFPDMLRRDPQTMPRCDLYVCGFPCKPFSILNRKSKGFREVQARPFTAVLKTLRTMLPPVAVLENVVGIRRYLDKVWSRLSRLRWYEVLTVRINPKDLGEPVTRDRMFFILVRLDVAHPNLDEQVGKLLLAGMATECCSLCCRLLPKGSRLLEPRRSGTCASASSRGALVASTGPQPTQRQQIAYVAARSALAKSSDGQAIDLGHSASWARMLDICPTVTPGARIWLVKEERFVTAVEKLFLNMVPVHLLKWPAELRDTDIQDLAGNTMHLKAVGLAMLIAMSLVEWGPVATDRPHGSKPSRRAKRPREVAPWDASASSRGMT